MRVNKIYSFFIICAAVFTVSSCLRVFSLDEFEQKPMLFVECFAGSNDSTVIKVLAASPINKSKGEYDIEKVSLELMLNGKLVELEKRYTESNLRSLYWYSDVKYNPGDKVSVRAHLDGVESVSAETIIPVVKPVASVRIYRETKNFDVRTEVSFSGSQCRYYGMRICQRLRSSDPIYESLYFGESVMMTVDDNVNYVKTDNNECFVFWDAEDYVSGKIDIQMNRSATIIAEDLSAEYKVMMYSLTPELYRYLLTLSANENGWSTGGDLLYRSLLAYSNISCGLGILGGLTKITSETIKTGTSVNLE